jgi:ferredoxin--NADP+ reductase
LDEARLNAVVTSKTLLSPGLMVLRVAPEGWDFPPFLPGQYATLGLPGTADRLIRRAYSIASSPANRDFLEFYLNLVPCGVLSPRLFDLRIGDRLWLSPRAVGRFTFDQVPAEADVLFIANGTGLAPFVSMLGTHRELAARQGRVALLHGVRHSWDLGYRAVFLAMQNLRDNFTYLPVLSRPAEEPAPWTGAAGHVQDLIARDGALDRAWGFHPGPDRTHVFLCGSPVMIEEMTAILLGEGFRRQAPGAPGTIHAESYWPLKADRSRGAGPRE